METTLVLLPESSRNSRVDSWSTHPSNLHRRQAETILSSDESALPASKPTAANASPSQVFPGLAEPKSLPLCFTSFNSCMTRTDNCSSHGECENRWAAKDDDGNRLPPQDGHAVCFKCACKKTRGGNGGNGSVTQWAGDTCDKVDLTTEVALFVGTGILLFTILGGAIMLLYSVGEQPLPGVLSAGVSKNT